MAKAATARNQQQPPVDDGWPDDSQVVTIDGDDDGTTSADAGTNTATQARAPVVKAKEEPEADDKDGFVADLQQRLTARDKELEEARKREAEASAERAKAEARAREAVDGQVRSDEVALNNAIVAAETQIASLKAQQRSAWEASEFDKAADISSEIASQQYRIEKHKDHLGEIATWKKNALAQAERQQQEAKTQQTQASPYSPKTQEWISQHPEVLSNPRLGQKAAAYAIEAEEQGYRPDTDEYFQYVESRLWPANNRQQQQQANDAEVVDLGGHANGGNGQQRTSVASMTAARPTRTGAASGASGVTTRRPTQVRLTSEERDMALRMYQGDRNMTNDERIKRYALNKAAMISEGTYKE